MSKVLQQVSACSPSQQTGTYIYAIAPTAGGGLATITSADELLLVDRQNMSTSNPIRFSGVPEGVTCLTPADEHGSGVLCAGRDGSIAAFDLRSQHKVAQFKLDRPVTALTRAGYDIGVGTELSHQQAIISVWDNRKMAQRWLSSENNDDITDLNFHPTRSHQLLSGGVDGLVSIFGTNICDEEESLLQVVNHGPIHKAGFMSEDKIYALSSDEQFSVHAVTTEMADNEVDSPPPVILGDMRPKVPCEYLVDVLNSADTAFLVAGTHSSNPRIDLVPIKDQARLKLNSKVTLLGAHGDEIVRAIYVDTESGTIFTAGEDGQIRAFRQPEIMEKSMREPKSPKIKRTSDARFKPY